MPHILTVVQGVVHAARYWRYAAYKKILKHPCLLKIAAWRSSFRKPTTAQRKGLLEEKKRQVYNVPQFI